MQPTQIHADRAGALTRSHDPLEPDRENPPAFDGYLAEVTATTSFNEGHLSWDLERGGAKLNADGSYAQLESGPEDRHAAVEIDGRFLPADLRRIAYGILVQADELEGR